MRPSSIHVLGTLRRINLDVQHVFINVIAEINTSHRMTRRGSLDMNEVERKQQNIEAGTSSKYIEMLQFGNVQKAKETYCDTKSKDLFLGFA